MIDYSVGVGREAGRRPDFLSGFLSKHRGWISLVQHAPYYFWVQRFHTFESTFLSNGSHGHAGEVVTVFRWPDHQGNPPIRDSRVLSPVRPRMQAAGLQCLKAPDCPRISRYGAFLENTASGGRNTLPCDQGPPASRARHSIRTKNNITFSWGLESSLV